MRTFLISYDLAAPAKNKQAIADTIMELGHRWARPLDQSWYIEVKGTAATVEDALTWMFGEEDGLLVQEVSERAVTSNTSIRWFKQRGGEAGNVVAFPRADAVTSSVEIEYPMAEAG